ncbi:MAG: creatininase family protein [Anaerolineales bacterium]|nr:creatininase family protein [Anaerolineales bacterium]
MALISEMNWPQVEAYLQQDDRAVLPLGSTEQHAYLSLSVDSILSSRLAAEGAAPLGVPVFPVIPYGLTPYFMAYPGTVTLSEATYAALVKEVLASLVQHGFRRILLVNGHGGNSPVRPHLAEWAAAQTGVQIQFHNWWNSPPVWQKVEEIDTRASHASWSENFPWTRLAGVVQPDEIKPMLDMARFRQVADPATARELLGDGNFGGAYQKPDADMLAIWAVAVAEVTSLLENWE